MNHFPNLGLTWGVCALACASAFAAPPAEPGEFQEGPTRYGIQVLVATPRQDFQAAGSRTGFGLGLFAEAELAPGTVAQTRFDFIRYPQSNRPDTRFLPPEVGTGGLSLASNAVALGVDLRHYLGRLGLQRAFILAGVMGMRYEFQTSDAVVVPGPQGQPVATAVRAKDATPFQLGLAVGLGCDIDRNWAVTLRYTSMSYEGSSLATLEGGLSYRF